jgi:hypothetical protein
MGDRSTHKVLVRRPRSKRLRAECIANTYRFTCNLRRSAGNLGALSWPEEYYSERGNSEPDNVQLCK